MSLTAISPIDGRYAEKTAALVPYFSEMALMRYRVWVEVAYFIALADMPLPGMPQLSLAQREGLQLLYTSFGESQAQRIKEIERQTNHDVKAVEYFIKEQLPALQLEPWSEFVHFGLTSQDVNNTAVPMLLGDALRQVMYPAIDQVAQALQHISEAWLHVPMLAHTHGQPASPTRLGKEILVFAERLHIQLEGLKAIPLTGKFGGATGNFNAHHAAFPHIDWPVWANAFLRDYLGLERQQTTTQIEHYDQLAATLHALCRVHTILIDLCRDMWSYIGMGYFTQRTKAGEVGSSAMPHKVNPIDFENAEGNLGVANALLEYLAAKLPVSRLQRDLTDSTVLRNLGVPLAHSLVALHSIHKGLNKIELNQAKLHADLDANWAVLAEAIQTVLRREGYPKPYEALRDLTRNNPEVTRASLHLFIDGLHISHEVKQELKALSPHTYLGVVPHSA